MWRLSESSIVLIFLHSLCMMLVCGVSLVTQLRYSIGHYLSCFASPITLPHPAESRPMPLAFLTTGQGSFFRLRVS